jgi:toxin ParE1/3/4
MAKIIWTEPALKDLHDLIEYIARDSKVYAERFGIHVVQAPLRLEHAPLIGRMVPEFNDPSIRELIYGSYRIIHKVDEEQVCFIVAVIHGSRVILEHLKPSEWEVE